MLLVTPFLLLALPADFFDHTGIELCLSKLLFDKSCYACGMTRAIMHLIHFEFDIALQYNRLCLLVLPLLIYLWVGELSKTFQSLGIKTIFTK
ncbi:MAG: DUF2752 domain-containing protein [Saprospiraceae bacterium]|nr:DUF2752 domain-containing protein [Saprospiraceae bacterium]